MLRKAGWFFAILVAVIAAMSVFLAILEPGSTNAGELGRAVGRQIVLMLFVTACIYFAARRLGWILRSPASREG